jgi:hypothetical protein
VIFCRGLPLIAAMIRAAFRDGTPPIFVQSAIASD